MTKDSRRSYRDFITGKRSSSKYSTYEGYYNITTGEMGSNYFRARKDGKGTDYKYRVPMNEPVEYAEKDLPVNPYVLGAWLGDGDSDNTRITICDEDRKELMTYIKQAGHEVSIIKRRNRIDAIGIDIGIGYKGNGKLNRLREQLREAGVFKNKHIPRDYLEASIEQRTELLKGLMDTDGYVSKGGQCEFCQADKGIINSVGELLGSLGIKHVIKKRKTPCNGQAFESYRIIFFTDKKNSCFKLLRKHNRLKDKLAARMNNKTIVDIKEVKSVHTQCIGVDSPENLFLAGRKFTSTHNTPYTAALAWGIALLERKSGGEIVMVGNLLKQAIQGFEFLLYNLEQMGEADNFRILNNNQERSISSTLGGGYIRIEALAGNSDRMDSLNTLVQILDELHLYKSASQYNTIRDSGKAYRNSLCIGITTAGHNMNSFCYNRLQYCKKILDGTVKNDDLFIFITKASEAEDGSVDYTDPAEHEKANPNYNVSVSGRELMNDAR